MSNIENRTITASDGISRTIEGRRNGQDYRVTCIYGDITDAESLMETLQVIACETGSRLVTLKL